MDRSANTDQGQCRSLGTSRLNGGLVEQKASLDAVDSIGGLVVGSSLAVDSSLAATVVGVAVGSKLVAEAGSRLVVEIAVVEAAVVAEAGSTVFEWEQQDEEEMRLSLLLEMT